MLTNTKDYYDLVREAGVQETEPFIAVYILSVTPEKRRFCLEMQKRLGGIKLVNILDGNPGLRDHDMKTLDYDHIKIDLEIEDFLYYFYHSQYIITDSYHGTCFSIIFEKNFAAIVNEANPDRFRSFLRFPQAAARVISDPVTCNVDDYTAPVDYDKLRQEMAPELAKSKAFIEKNIL